MKNIKENLEEIKNFYNDLNDDDKLLVSCELIKYLKPEYDKATDRYLKLQNSYIDLFARKEDLNDEDKIFKEYIEKELEKLDKYL